jgi:hypothetical protein
LETRRIRRPKAIGHPPTPDPRGGAIDNEDAENNRKDRYPRNEWNVPDRKGRKQKSTLSQLGDKITRKSIDYVSELITASIGTKLSRKEKKALVGKYISEVIREYTLPPNVFDDSKLLITEKGDPPQS